MKTQQRVQLTVGHVTDISRTYDGNTVTTTTQYLPTTYIAERPSSASAEVTLECGIDGCDAKVHATISNYKSAETKRQSLRIAALIVFVVGLIVFIYALNDGFGIELTEPAILFSSTIALAVPPSLLIGAAVSSGVKHKRTRGHILRVYQHEGISPE